ncbi:MAG: TIGR03767 family metallophosphoesterase [Candidatus Dormibacteraeota bacterium]|nr:TIGR03767 family metallophosphoesterase [Candidatus Dormibacteraeota bacterium]
MIGRALTLDRRLDAGEVQRRGSLAPYLSVAEVDGEPHTVRSELVGAAAGAGIKTQRAIACLAHITDLHMTDVESPARFEFINREYSDPRFRELLPMQRAQEALNAHAIDAMIQSLNQVTGGPLTGRPLELVAMTGDAVDNAQRNELGAVIALLEGGLVRPGSGGPEYEGVQAPSWPDDIFWKPEGAAQGEDVYREAFGFPLMPGLLERALESFHASGLRLPWLACHGNHEQVCQGVGIVTPAIAAAAVRTRKPFRLPDGLDFDTVVETFVKRPEAFMAGPYVDVTADPARRPFSLPEFVDVHIQNGARPHGHGFTAQNRQDGTAYYVHDTPAVRFITLDTACPAGGPEGCITKGQLQWLERRLEEVHSSFRSRDGTSLHTSQKDRLVVILSHHGLDTLTNPRVHVAKSGSGHVDAGDLLDTMLRFGNVVLWLNGHIHANRIHARTDPRGHGGGFWEVTTASLVDWPCQGRIVEVVDAGDDLLAIACTMVDHQGSELASLHRELAGNAPAAGFASGRAGTQLDRNVILPLRAPFSLARLQSD